MSNTIILKKSAVTGNAPASGDLSLGEIAINYADGHVSNDNACFDQDLANRLIQSVNQFSNLD